MFYMKYSYIRLVADILGTRCEKYSSKLDISRSFLAIFALWQIYLALAVKNIQASLIFLARFFVYSQMLSAGEVSSVCQAMVE